MSLPLLKGTVFFIYPRFNMVSFRGKKNLGHAQIGLHHGFNLKFPTSIPPLLKWESIPPGANLLHANPKKYQVLAMTPRNVDKTAKGKGTLDIDNQRLKPTANLRILGVNIDDQLTFTEYVSDICKKASKKIGVLSRLCNLISSKTKLQLYLTAILPHLTYCQIVWHFCKQSERRKLERLQERALRVIYNCRTCSDTYTPCKADLSLYNRRLQDIVTLMYKVRNGLPPDNIVELFNTANKGYSFKVHSFIQPTSGNH